MKCERMVIVLYCMILAILNVLKLKPNLCTSQWCMCMWPVYSTRQMETLVLAGLSLLAGRTRRFCREDARASRGRHVEPLFPLFWRIEPLFPLVLHFLFFLASISRVDASSSRNLCKNESFILTLTVVTKRSRILR